MEVIFVATAGGRHCSNVRTEGKDDGGRLATAADSILLEGITLHAPTSALNVVPKAKSTLIKSRAVVTFCRWM